MAASAIAVTGASGFLGAHLVRGFEARGAAVLPLVRTLDERAPRGREPAQLLDGIVRDPAQLGDRDVLVHCAAVRHRYGTPASGYRESNVDLVERLLRAIAGRVRRFVYVSSVGVYGFPARLPVDETHPYAPVTLYSATKVDAEYLVMRRARELGLEFAIVRPTIFYGPGDTNGMLDKTARMIRAGTYRVVGDGKNSLHHTHIDDIVEGVCLASTHAAAAGEDFILCGPQTITLQSFSELVARHAGKRLARAHIPLAFARAVAAAIDVAAYRGLAFASREPPLNNEKLDVMTVPIAFDGGKARRLLGFHPRVGYEEGIAQTLAPSAT